MDFMRRKHLRIRDKIVFSTIVFIILFAFLIDMFSQNIIFDTMEAGIYKNINGVCNEVRYFIRKNYSTDFHVSEGQLYAGNKMLSGDSEFLDSLKRNFDAEITIFYGNVRYLTTIRDEAGRLLLYTEQNDSDILETVFGGGTYQAKGILINGGKYYGVYNPLEDSAGEVCGMVFAGYSEKGLVKTRSTLIISIVLISTSLCAVIVFIVSLFTGRLCRDLDSIRSFLYQISRNEMNISIDEGLLQRNDEVGQLGLYAMKISSNIMDLINKDSLTHMYNRRSGEKRLDVLCKSPGPQDGGRLTFAIGDIDFFKQINDTYGHHMGDDVLVAVAQIMMRLCPEPDCAIRWGGEEFLLILNVGKDEALRTLCGIRDSLATVLFQAAGGDFHVTMTFGVAEYEPGEDCYEAIRRADKNLYQGKERGRNCIIAE